MRIHEITARERILGGVILVLILGFFILPLVTIFGDFYQPWSANPFTYIHHIFHR